MAKTLVDMDEEELTEKLAWAVMCNGSNASAEVAKIIRRMIENSLIEAGISSNVGVDHG